MSTIAENLLSFIERPDVREQMQKDVVELHGCMEHRYWKAAIVLIGSLIETGLYYHIDSTPSIQNKIPNFHQRNDIGLAKLLEWAKEHKVIDETLFRLTDPIRDYRNLIHPKVQERLKVDLSETIVQIGYNVLLEVLRNINEHHRAARSEQLEVVVTEIVQTILSRTRSEADLMIYSPILEKYGIPLGSKIIERSLKAGIYNGKTKSST